MAFRLLTSTLAAIAFSSCGTADLSDVSLYSGDLFEGGFSFERVTFYDGTLYGASGNDDGLPNSNETIRMAIEVLNNGTADILGVTATLSTISDLVDVSETDSVKSFGDIPVGSFAGNYYDHYGCECFHAASSDAFLITILSTATAGSVIPFTLTFTDKRG